MEELQTLAPGSSQAALASKLSTRHARQCMDATHAKSTSSCNIGLELPRMWSGASLASFHNSLLALMTPVDCAQMWSGSRRRFMAYAQHKTAPTVRYNEGDQYMGLRQRTGAVLQLRKDFQSSESAGHSATSPIQQVTAARASWLRQPDPGLIGNEQTHQWLLPWVFGALFIIGVVTAARGWQQVQHAAASASWPYTRGVIVSSEVETYWSSEGVRWRPIITYAYRVGKREVLGRRVNLVDPVSAFDEADAREYAERYRLHGDVLVYYNPERVNESVLDQNPPHTAYLSINLGLALATASAALLMLTVRSARRVPRTRPAIAS